MLKNFRQFRSMPKADRKLFMRIAFVVPLVEISLKLVGFNQIVNFLHRFSNFNGTVQNQSNEVKRYKRLLFLFYAKFPFAGKCLARSIALWFLLKRKGIETDLRFGMKKENGKLLAHAWVEYKGKPLTLDPEVHLHYTPFSEPIIQKALRS